jgi:galactokinase
MAKQEPGSRADAASIDGSARLADAFREHFGSPDAGVLIHAPGRVNLIGEHTDYNGLPVFPMAIRHGISVLSRARPDPTVRLVNTNPDFGPVEFEIAGTIPPYPAGHWGNYVKAAAQVLYREHGVRHGFDGVLQGEVPVAAGLSSSSALVVASGLTLLGEGATQAGRMQLMDDFARAEIYVGTRGGGMDQAICLGAESGSACLIDFAPLRLRHVAIPEGWTFVVASSLVPAEKSGARQAVYNRRTEECRGAIKLVSRALVGTPPGSYPELMDGRPLEELLALAERTLTDPLLRRFRHVVTEADRVTQAVEAMEQDAPDRFGRLMAGSHESLRDDYGVSCPELDELVDISMAAGAFGARLTGAGFGGCIVALSSVDGAAAVLSALADGFYRSRLDRAPSVRELFIAVPSGGARRTKL